MQDHTKLHVWRRAHAFTVAIFELTATFDQRKATGLTAQLRRAAASIGSNIAEGAGQSSPGQFARFLTMSVASMNECANHLLLARDLRLVDHDRWLALTTELGEIRAMTRALIDRIREREANLPARR